MPGIPGAIDELFRIKGRGEEKPIPILGAGVRALAGVVSFDVRARRVAEKFWPGPLTLVLPRAPGFTAALGAPEAPGVGVRVPAFAPALELLGLAGVLAVTSANRSGEAPATTVEEARAIFESEVDVFVDGGNCNGQPSSVVSLLDDPELLRAGSVPIDSILEVLGPRGVEAQ
jgi:tRNA threonylcarbamoyl adenosine modification protein (Sua5/YciO/YrdC/YwlC family)